MANVARFSYTVVKNKLDETALRPMLPATLTYHDTDIQVSGLLDTGADVNVLPYHVGIALGCVWEQARTGLQLSGNLAVYEARGVLVTCTVGQLHPVSLAFAWTRVEHVPLIFGQVNFFAAFDICLFRTQNIFEVRSSSEPT